MLKSADRGDFTVVDPEITAAEDGASTDALQTIATPVDAVGVSVEPVEQTLNPINSTQIILDNIPGIRDGDPSNGTNFTSFGEYRASTEEPGRIVFC